MGPRDEIKVNDMSPQNISKAKKKKKIHTHSYISICVM